MHDAQTTVDLHRPTMADAKEELAAVAEVLAGLYERLLAERLTGPATEPVLDGLFDSIATIEKILGGDIGPRARGVLQPPDSL